MASNAVHSATTIAGSSKKIGIIILGNNGFDKSSLGNIILRRELFQLKFSPDAATLETEYRESTVNDKIYAIYNIPNLIEANRERIDINVREVNIAFQRFPHAVVIYVFSVGPTGCLHNEDFIAFNAFNSVYSLNEKSLIIVVNRVPVNRPDDYELKKTAELRRFLDIGYSPYICYVNSIKTMEEEEAVHQQLVETITKVVSKQKEHLIESQYAKKQYEYRNPLQVVRLGRAWNEEDHLATLAAWEFYPPFATFRREKHEAKPAAAQTSSGIVH